MRKHISHCAHFHTDECSGIAATESKVQQADLSTSAQNVASASQVPAQRPTPQSQQPDNSQQPPTMLAQAQQGRLPQPACTTPSVAPDSRYAALHNHEAQLARALLASNLAGWDPKLPAFDYLYASAAPTPQESSIASPCQQLHGSSERRP